MTTAKERIKQKIQVKAQRIKHLKFEKGRNSTGRIKYLRLIWRNSIGKWENNPPRSKNFL